MKLEKAIRILTRPLPFPVNECRHLGYALSSVALAYAMVYWAYYYTGGDPDAMWLADAETYARLQGRNDAPVRAFHMRSASQHNPSGRPDSTG